MINLIKIKKCKFWLPNKYLYFVEICYILYIQYYNYKCIGITLIYVELYTAKQFQNKGSTNTVTNFCF